MNAIENMLQLDGFFAGIEQMRQAFPREMMLAEGTMLGALGLGALVFLLVGLVRGSGRALSAAAFCGVLALMVAFLFGRLGFLPEGSGLILQALIIGAAILFLTVTIKVARDNILVGLIMLAGLVGAVGLGAAGFTGLYAAELPMQMLLVATAFCAVVMVLFLALGGDRRAVLLSMPVLLCAGALLAMLVGARAGVGHWFGAVLPFGMLTIGALFAGLMALIPVPDAAPAERRVEAPSFSDEAIVSFGDEQPDELPESLTAFDEKATAQPEREAPDAPANPIQDVQNTDETQVKTQSPISALWGGGSKAAPVTAAGALWDWSASGDVAASEQTPGLFGVKSNEELTPETLRGLLAHDSLEEFDDAILGGEAPVSGPLDLLLTLGNGQRLQLAGTRHVDEDGLVSRIEARVSKYREETPVAPDTADVEPAGPRFTADTLKAAITGGEIRAWFQPIVKVDSEEIAGFEALARWHQPGEEPLSAEDFIPSVIEAGLETEVIERIAGEAAKELAEWIAAEPGRGQFVSFNISAASLIDNTLVKIVQKAIKDHKLPEGALVVELTESHVVENQSKALQVAKALRQAGARLALDDLGAGYSSLNQLTKFKFDIVKTDRSLIAAITEDDHARTLLGGVIDLARKLGMQVVAEGTESAAAAAMLHDMGCDYAQGYHFGAPEPAEGVETLSEDEPAAPVAMAELR